MEQKTFTYIDPKAPRDVEYNQALRSAQNWSWFAKIWNSEKAGAVMPEKFEARTVDHDRQSTYDYNNCGIYCLSVCNAITLNAFCIKILQS